AHHRCRTTGLCPDTAWQSALDEKRSKLQPVPPSALCDLHFAILGALMREHWMSLLPGCPRRFGCSPPNVEGMAAPLMFPGLVSPPS
ncbi:MAG: hypothetical protein NTX68_07645, partial [Rhodococcus sp.]